MGSMKLLASHVLDCKFQKLTLINQGYQENNRTHNVMRIKKLALIYYKSRNFSNFLQHRQAILAKKEKEKKKATASKQEKKHNCSLIKHNLT
jgi:hypothetical protein